MLKNRDWRDIVTISCYIGGPIIIGAIFGVNYYFFPEKFKSKSISPPNTDFSPVSPSNSSSKSSTLSDETAKNLISQWLQAKNRVFGSNYDKSSTQDLLTGLAYEKNITSSSSSDQSSVDDLKNDGMYYTYENQIVHQITSISDDNDIANVKAIVSERRLLHSTRQGTTKSSSSDHKTVCYEFSRTNSNWKISKTPELFSSCN
jgi:ARC6-like, IMS domain